MKVLARGPLRYVWSFPGYFVNGYKFHTLKHGVGRVTHNSGVCVKGSSYNEYECDYYGSLDEVLEVEYHGVGRCVVVLFKCYWIDPVQGVKVDPKHNLVDIKYKSKLKTDDPFVLASQVQQVYYAPYPSMTKDLKDWWAVIKTKPRSVYEVAQYVTKAVDDANEDEDQFFQENERIHCTAPLSTNEAIEPLCLVVEGETEEVANNDDVETYLTVSDDEDEFEDTDHDSDDDTDDELNLSDHSFDE